MRRRRVIGLVCGLASLALVLGGCSALRDKEPFTWTIAYDDDPANPGKITVAGLPIQGDAAFGEVQVVNDADDNHGFAIDELAVYEEIPSGRTKTINIQEARDKRTYIFYCQIHPNEIRGEIKIVYLSEERRR